MERKRSILCIILISAAMLITSCLPVPAPVMQTTETTLIFDIGQMHTKAKDPDETRLTDVNILVFDSDGHAEECIWIPDAGETATIHLIKGNIYSIRACANFGYRINVTDIKSLTDIRFHLAYPDEYRNGIPMMADTDYINIPKDGMITMKFTRLMSKISIRMDRSHLSEDVKMNVCGIKIGNCPRSASVFRESRARNADDCFPLGFNKEGEECNILNIMESNGLSYPISLYMLENIQGKFSDTPVSDDSKKVFDTYDPRRETCSYIELNIDYLSSDKASKDGYLKYRFYLGEDLNDLSVERNCHYQITITPEDDGLKEDSWRVDKSCITSTLPPTFSYYPESYIRGDIGDIIHLGCRFTPLDAPFDIGQEYMENDKREGIYDYIIDADGHGATITLTGPGSGLIYMSVGSPVNEAALWFIEVNQPREVL